MTLDEYLTDLNEKAKAKGLPRTTDAAFGELIGVTQPQVGRLRKGASRPSWKTMIAVEEVTKGLVRPTAEDWPLHVEAAE